MGVSSITTNVLTTYSTFLVRLCTVESGFNSPEYIRRYTMCPRLLSCVTLNAYAYKSFRASGLKEKVRKNIHPSHN